MAGDRARRRAFRPAVDGHLESRCLLSQGGTAAIAAHRVAAQKESARPLPLIGSVRVLVANGGRTARIIDTDGEQYNIIVLGGGTVHAKPASGGRVNLTVDGTTAESELTINPFGPILGQGDA